MDHGRHLTVQQKEKLIRSVWVLTALLVLDLAAWYFLGKLTLLLWVACGLGGLLAVMGLSIAFAVLVRVCTAKRRASGRRLTIGQMRKLKMLLCCLLILFLLGVGYAVLLLIPDMEVILDQIKQDWDTIRQWIQPYLPNLGFSLPQIEIRFWHLFFGIIGICFVGLMFYGDFLAGIITLPIIAGYEILLLGACSGYFVQDSALFMRLMGWCLVVLLISGFFMKSWNGIWFLIDLLHIMVPLTLIAIIAVLLQEENPAGSPPVNFRAVYNWIILLIMFTAQCCQLLDMKLPVFRWHTTDNSVNDQSGNEYTDSYWW